MLRCQSSTFFPFASGTSSSLLPPSSSATSATFSSSTHPASSLPSSLLGKSHGTKRGSVDREHDTFIFQDDDDDDERPFKRIDVHHTSDDEEVQEEEDEEAGPEQRPRAVAADDEGGDGSEDTFLNLLTHFANLHVPSSSMKPEQCPVCSQLFPLSGFADHVYQCIKALDDVERKEQERLDEKMARQLMAREVRLLDESEHHSSSYARDRRERGTDCPDGADCQRTEHAHFANRKHPDVSCPVCSAAFPPYEINAHINFCLNDSNSHSGGEEGKRKGDAGAGGMEDETAATERADMEEGGAGSSAVGGLHGPQPRSAAFSLLRTDSELKQGHDDDDDDRRLPLARDSDDDEEEDHKRPTSISPLQDPAALRSSSASPLSSSSPSDLRLTVEQASAVASHIIARKSRFEVTGGGANNDPSLLSLLETFKTLGFTQENLSKLKAAEEGKGQEGAQIQREERKE